MQDDDENRMLAVVTDHDIAEGYATSNSSRILLTVEAAASRLSIGRTTMYALIKAGAVESVLVGRLRRIPVDALTRYIDQLRTDGPESDHPDNLTRQYAHAP